VKLNAPIRWMTSNIYESSVFTHLIARKL
jgi:hypothetical protein